MDPNTVTALAALIAASTHGLREFKATIEPFFAPLHEVRMAKAKAQSREVETASVIAADGRLQRAKYQRERDEVRHQANLEQIVIKAARRISDDAPIAKPDPDVIAHLFDEAKNVGNDEMQELWARLLSEEVNRPGSFSKRTITFVKSMEYFEAKAFASICQLSDDDGHLIAQWDSTFLEDTLGIRRETLEHLETIGLIHIKRDGGSLVWSSIVPDNRTDAPLHHESVFSYPGRQLIVKKLVSPGGGRVKVAIGSVAFTKLGHELFTLVDRQASDSVINHVMDVLGRLYGQDVRDERTNPKG